MNPKRFDELKSTGLLPSPTGVGLEILRLVRKESTSIEEIAKVKMQDLNCYDMEAAVRLIAGSARSMGIETEGV